MSRAFVPCNHIHPFLNHIFQRVLGLENIQYKMEGQV